MTQVDIRTDRLNIYPTQRNDAAFSVSIWLDPVMGKYLSDPPKESAGADYEEWINAVETFDGCYYFTAYSKDDSAPIGTCSAVPQSDNHRWDIGYTIHQDYWNQGYAKEMIQGLIHWCAENGGTTITATVAKQNEPSNAVLKKLGFSIESEGSFKKQHTDIVYEKYTYTLDLVTSVSNKIQMIDVYESAQLLNGLDQLHTTELGLIRIRKNLSLDVDDIIKWSKPLIQHPDATIIRRGKNWYVTIADCEFTINAHSYTIITAHKTTKKNR